MTDSIINIIVKPNSSVNKIDGIYNERIKISINAPPEKGKANRELVKFISKKTGIARSGISIIYGKFSNYKKLMIKNSKNLDLEAKLLGNKKS